jgi:hypothetical protein
MTTLKYDSNKNGFRSRRIQFIFAGILFKIILDISYSTYLTNEFANHFLTPFVVNFSIYHLLESYLWLTMVLFFVPCSSRAAGGLAFFSAIIFLYTPVASIYGLDSERSRYTLFLSTLAIVVAYLVGAASGRRTVKITFVKGGHRVILGISFLFAGLFLMIAASSGALFNMNFNVARVYEFRSDLSAKIDFGVFSYTNLWSQKVFTPLILAIGLYRKSPWMIAFALGMHLIYFGVTQHRSHLFTPVLVYIAFVLYRYEFSYANGFLFLATVLAALNMIIFMFDLQALAALIIRRALFVGASVTYSWIDYFAVNPKVYFSDNILSSVVQNTYTGVNLPKFMGDYMRSDVSLAFNSGLVGAGFAQLGVVGVAIYGAIIGVFIRINKRLIKSGVPPYIHAAILFLPYRIAWADAELMTALLSHGIIVGTFAVWLYGKSTVRRMSGSNTSFGQPFSGSGR